MNRLILLRHAKSDYPPSVRDHDRPLSGRGRRNAQSVSEYLSEWLPAGLSLGVAVSTSARTQETWGIVHEALDDMSRHVSVTWYDRGLYLAEPSAIADVASAFTTDIGLIVGHNPGIQDFVLSHSFPSPSVRTQVAQKFPTASFAVLESSGTTAGWIDHNAQCVDFVTCR